MNVLEKTLKEGGSIEDIHEKIEDLREKISGMKEQGSFKGTSFTVVYKSCPQCGGTVQVQDESEDIGSCPHCGYTKT